MASHRRKKEPQHDSASSNSEETLKHWQSIATDESRRNPLFKAGYEAMEKVLAYQALLSHGPPLPEIEFPLWFQNICEKLFNSKAVAALAQISDPRLKAKKQGEVVGKSLGLAMRVRDESTEGAFRLGQDPYATLAAWQFQAAFNYLNLALHSKQELAVAFFEGFAKGQKFVFRSKTLASTSDATAIHQLLLFYHSEVVQKKTVEELHRFLEQFVVKGWLTHDQLGDIGRLQKICYRLGLKLKNRGRPRKSDNG